MENGILSEISLFLNKQEKEDNTISLHEIINFIESLKKDFEKNSQIIIKKMNKKLSKHLNFFNYEIKKIELRDTVELIIDHELEIKRVSISKDGKILTNIKNKDSFKNILIDEINELIILFNDFLNWISINIKTKVQNLSITIDNNLIGIFMYKSKNWITMGKAFSLKYDVFSSQFIYDIDNIGLQKFLDKKESKLFDNIFIKKTLLPNDFQLKYETYLNKKMENKNNSISNFVNKLRNIMKKK